VKKTLLIISFFISACVATKSIVPSQETLPAMQQKVPGITLEKANQGYKLYKEKCAGCHRLHAPAEYTIPKWDKALIEMYPKAKVTSEEEKKLIRDYLYALSK
jgi:mono/diheme cytochrome c family protein